MKCAASGVQEEMGLQATPWEAEGCACLFLGGYLLPILRRCGPVRVTCFFIAWNEISLAYETLTPVSFLYPGIVPSECVDWDIK